MPSATISCGVQPTRSFAPSKRERARARAGTRPEIARSSVRLARAVGADQRDDLARRHVETSTPCSACDRAVVDVEALDLEQQGLVLALAIVRVAASSPR